MIPIPAHEIPLWRDVTAEMIRTELGSGPIRGLVFPLPATPQRWTPVPQGWIDADGYVPYRAADLCHERFLVEHASRTLLRLALDHVPLQVIPILDDLRESGPGAKPGQIRVLVTPEAMVLLPDGLSHPPRGLSLLGDGALGSRTALEARIARICVAGLAPGLGGHARAQALRQAADVASLYLEDLLCSLSEILPFEEPARFCMAPVGRRVAAPGVVA